MKHTPEEISLCKQVAERWRKPLKNFDLVIGTYLSGKEFIGYFHEDLTKEKLGMKARLDEVIFDFCETAKTTKPMIPLWTISDCLEFLRKRKRIDGEIRLAYIDHHNRHFVHIFEENTPSTSKVVLVESGKTPLEACLKAVLAVLEKEEK